MGGVDEHFLRHFTFSATRRPSLSRQSFDFGVFQPGAARTALAGAAFRTARIAARSPGPNGAAAAAMRCLITKGCISILAWASAAHANARWVAPRGAQTARRGGARSYCLGATVEQISASRPREPASRPPRRLALVGWVSAGFAARRIAPDSEAVPHCRSRQKMKVAGCRAARGQLESLQSHSLLYGLHYQTAKTVFHASGKIR